jgi:hypothetical protein
MKRITFAIAALLLLTACNSKQTFSGPKTINVFPNLGLEGGFVGCVTHGELWKEQNKYAIRINDGHKVWELHGLDRVSIEDDPQLQGACSSPTT